MRTLLITLFILLPVTLSAGAAVPRNDERDRGRDGVYDQHGDYRASYGYAEVGRIVTLRGQVESVNVRLNRIYVRGDRGSIEVLVGRQTDIREFGRRRALGDIRSGAQIVATGRLETLRTLSANTINIGGPDPGFRRQETLLTGVVVRSTRTFDRTIVVRTPLGDQQLNVPRGIDVRLDGIQASIHDIRVGDQVRSVGNWSGNTFVPRQLLATRVQDRGLTGQILRIDKGDVLLVDIGGRRYTVQARGADIRFQDGRRASFKDLKRGDTIRLFGERRSDRISAHRIEITRRSR